MELAVIEGREYYWDGRYYARHKGLKSPIRAHTEVWEARFGPIPSGYEIHHLDHDRRNNKIENLLVVDGSMHARLHGQTAERMRVVQVLGREAAKAWHASDEGKKAHKAQFEAQMEKIGELECPECSTIFRPTNFRQKYCCRRCQNRVKMRRFRARKLTKLGSSSGPASRDEPS